MNLQVIEKRILVKYEIILLFSFLSDLKYIFLAFPREKQCLTAFNLCTIENVRNSDYKLATFLRNCKKLFLLVI